MTLFNKLRGIKTNDPLYDATGLRKDGFPAALADQIIRAVIPDGSGSVVIENKTKYGNRVITVTPELRRCARYAKVPGKRHAGKETKSYGGLKF